MRVDIALLILVCLSLTIFGCSASQKTDAAINPQQLSITLWRATQARQYTYFELKTSGELHFSGGRNAMQRVAKPVMTVSREQIDELWQVIEKHNLLKAQSAPFLAKPKEVEIDIHIRSRKGGKSFRSVDGSEEGAKALHDLLFKIQADHRYALPALEGHYDHKEKK